LIGWYILLGILLLLFLICLIRIQVFAQYTDEVRLSIKILFYELKLLPKPEKPKKKPEKKKKEPKKPKQEPEKKEEEEKEKKPSYLSKLKDKKGLTGIISLFAELAQIAGGALKGIFKHIVIKKMNVGIALNAGDAASTALQYGKLCSAVYPSVNVIAAVTDCKDYNVTLEPIFDDERETEIFADLYAYIRIGFILWHGIVAGVKILIARLKM